MDLTKYHYAFNALAFFEVQDKFPDGIYEAISLNTKEGLDNICWSLQLLSEQGELIRRSYGYEPEEIFKADEWKSQFRPRDILTARSIIIATVEAGLASGQDEDTDLTLVELKKKKD